MRKQKDIERVENRRGNRGP
jgi:hypothetical protein